MYLYSFSGQGYDISLVAISKKENSELHALNNLAQFTDQLVEFLEKRKF